MPTWILTNEQFKSLVRTGRLHVGAGLSLELDRGLRAGELRWALRKAGLHAAVGLGLGLGGSALLSPVLAVVGILAGVAFMELVHVHRGQPAWKTLLDLGTWTVAATVGAALRYW